MRLNFSGVCVFFYFYFQCMGDYSRHSRYERRGSLCVKDFSSFAGSEVDSLFTRTSASVGCLDEDHGQRGDLHVASRFIYIHIQVVMFLLLINNNQIYAEFNIINNKNLLLMVEVQSIFCYCLYKLIFSLIKYFTTNYICAVQYFRNASFWMQVLLVKQIQQNRMRQKELQLHSMGICHRLPG